MTPNVRDLSGTSITAESGQTYHLTEMAGSGAQGVVYFEKSRRYVVKLYYPTGSASLDEAVLDRLRFIQKVKMPSNFVPILDLIHSPYPGYVMERVSNHIPLNRYLFPNNSEALPQWYNQGRGLYERLLVGYIIAKAFGALEKENLAYCDISGNNILVQTDISKGISVKMIDVDNIYIAGKGASAVLGTPRYIAPEIISGQKNPDVLSDNYSLAVILFELLRVGHPYISDEVLDGPPEGEETALAGGADYVTEENSTNMLPASAVLTEKLEELFRRCFVDGKKNRLDRPSAIEFEFALLDASNKLTCCPSCGAWHYARKDFTCPWCDAPSRPKALLNFFDVLFQGEDYKEPEKIISSKPINSYILRENWKNRIKYLYVLRQGDPELDRRAGEDCLIVAANGEGFHAYNKFLKSGLVIRQYRTGQYITMKPNDHLLLRSGDEIYFELLKGGAARLSCSGTQYSFIRKAVFREV